jgi:CheY-like chemotaxis protein
VDDDEDQLELRRMLLEHCGFLPACATSPEVAFEVAQRSRPEVAVVDLHLPTEAHGWRLISRLKQDLPELSIVVLSGTPRSGRESIPECDLVDAWVTKGTGSGVLIDTLHALAA